MCLSFTYAAHPRSPTVMCVHGNRDCAEGIFREPCKPCNVASAVSTSDVGQGLQLDTARTQHTNPENSPNANIVEKLSQGLAEAINASSSTHPRDEALAHEGEGANVER